MKDNFATYQSMKAAGIAPEQVYRQAVADGIDAITRIRLIRNVFSLSPREAKEVIVRADGAQSLDEHQEKIAHMIATKMNGALPRVGSEMSLRGIDKPASAVG